MRAGNPVLRREVMERWRSRRAAVTLTVYLAILGAVMYLLYRVGTTVLSSGFGFGGVDPGTAGPVLGRFLLEGLFFFVLLLVLFVGPGYAAAQISGERERRTLTLLQVTLLRPFQIVLGKLGAAVAWLTLLVAAAVPLGAVAFFLGGIGLVDLLRGGAMLIVLAVAFAGIALGISSLTRRTTGSIVLTYGAVLALTLGTFFVAGVQAVVKSTRNQPVGTPVALYFNPFFGLADAVNAARPSMSGMSQLPSPLGIIAEALPGSPFVGDQFIETEAAVGGGFAPAGPMPMPVPDQFPLQNPPQGRPVWLIVMAIYTAMGGLGVALATRRLRITEPRRGAVAVAVPGTPAPPSGPAVPGPSDGWESS